MEIIIQNVCGMESILYDDDQLIHMSDEQITIYIDTVKIACQSLQNVLQEQYMNDERYDDIMNRITLLLEHINENDENDDDDYESVYTYDNDIITYADFRRRNMYKPVKPKHARPPVYNYLRRIQDQINKHIYI